MENLPSYNKPPVVEVAVSLQFPAVAGFTNAHLGFFWERIRSEFPQAMDAAPIEGQIELFGDRVVRLPMLPTFRVVAGSSPSRLQMYSADRSEMVQLQNGRLVYNWRLVPGGMYPRWRAVYPRFQEMRQVLERTMADYRLGELAAEQWEITYVNQLVRGRDWQTPADWPSLLPGLLGRLCAAGMAVEGLSMQTHATLPDCAARLHSDLFHGYAGPDPGDREVLFLQLTARGHFDPPAREADAFYGIGHQAIIRAFSDVTGREAQQRWERLS